jgi:HEPN domain
MEGQEPYLDTAVYHCQQAAEKALKAFLTARDIAFEKTHNLVALWVWGKPTAPSPPHAGTKSGLTRFPRLVHI